MIEDGHLKHSKHTRRKIIEISCDVFATFFHEGTFIECISGIPQGSKVVGAYPSSSGRTLMLVIENLEFEEAPDGLEYPKMNPTFKSYWGKELGVIRKLIASVKKAQDPENEKAEDRY